MTAEIPRFWIFRLRIPRHPKDNTGWRSIGTARTAQEADHQVTLYQKTTIHDGLINYFVWDSQESRWL